MFFLQPFGIHQSCQSSDLLAQLQVEHWLNFHLLHKWPTHFFTVSRSNPVCLSANCGDDFSVSIPLGFMVNCLSKYNDLTRWCFQISFNFSPLLVEMMQFDKHIFQMGLKPTTRWVLILQIVQGLYLVRSYVSLCLLEKVRGNPRFESKNALFYLVLGNCR